MGRRPPPSGELRLSRELPPPRQSGPGWERSGILRYTPVVSVLLALAALAISTVVLLLILREDEASREDTTALGAFDRQTAETTTEEGQDVEADAVGGPTAQPVEGAYVLATLDSPDFLLEGVVPSASLASSLLQSAEVAYSPFVRSELSVDEQLDETDWLSTSPTAIVFLPIITDGSMLISDGRIVISGRSPSSDRVALLQGALTEATGLSVEVGPMEITDLAPPELVLAAEGGQVVLSGRLPTEELKQVVVAGAVSAYGDGNVEDQIVVDPAVFESLWMYSGGQLMQAMSAFPDYELRVDGTAFSGFINGGVTFETGSDVFSGNYAEVLDVGVAVLTRDQSLQLVIEGHTDSIGPDDVNLELSQRRAEAVMNYFIENGIAAERLTAVGKGETEPVVANDTPEGQARNRRIQYVLTSNQ